jgi:hypothetical protein
MHDNVATGDGGVEVAATAEVAFVVFNIRRLVAIGGGPCAIEHPYRASGVAERVEDVPAKKSGAAKNQYAPRHGFVAFAIIARPAG